MEIGSFLELQVPSGMEYHKGDSLARLNSGRAAIWHALRLSGCAGIWLPYYQCDTVRDFLIRKGCRIRYYHIDSTFTPVDADPAADEAVLLVNYFGIMSLSRMTELTGKYENVIIDSCQAFYAPEVPGAWNVYSARKFCGVPDGAYVTGKDAARFCNTYPRGYSSGTSAFLLERIEYGCEGKAYSDRTLNEERIDSEDIMRMSVLTRTLLDGTDNDFICGRRRENFETASRLFEDVNILCPGTYYDSTCVPMVYPFLAEDDSLLERLQSHKHFQGHWWSYLLDEMPPDTYEAYLSRYMIPITIDQRYGEEEIKYIRSLI